MKQVSFRGLVGNDDSKRSSHTTSSGGDDDEEASSLASSSSQKTPSLSLGERLLRTHKHRDPLRYYEITKVLGSGSMGSVRKVRKRTFGGSARQAFVRNEAAQNNEPSAGGGGILGRAFPCLSFCLPGNNNSETMAPSSSSLKRSKFVAFENEGTNSGQTLVSTGNDSAISALTAETKILPRSTMTGTVTTKDEKQAKYHQSKSSSSMISFGTSVSVDFALKNIILSKCTNDSYRQELLHEIAVLQSLDHPNIVRAIETYDYKKQMYLVLELCNGGDLYTRDPYTERQAKRITYHLMDAIAYLHSKNITHRDLKYENIMFASPTSDTVKIIDFGLAKKYSNADTSMNETVGTIVTMAPEVIKGNYDQKCDVWSMGVITFMLLSSALPFFGDTTKEVCDKILGGKWKFRGKRWKAVSPECKAFVKKMLTQKPEDRPTATSTLEDSWFENDKDFKVDEVPFSASVMDRVQASIQLFAGYSRLKKLALLVIAHQSIDEEIGFLHRLFLHRFDTEKANANVSYPEFREALKEYDYGDAELRHMFNAIDFDGTGKISFTEFLSATIEAHGTIEEERIAEAFDRIDCDDSGYITVENLREMLGDEVDERFIEEVKQDEDEQPYIDYDKFLSLWDAQYDERLKRTLLEVQNRRTQREKNSSGQGGSRSAGFFSFSFSSCTTSSESFEYSTNDSSDLFFNSAKAKSIRGVWA